MMADHQLFDDDNGDDDIFVYTGGEQRVPRDVRRVRIAENVDTIPASTFEGCRQLREVEGHDRLRKIEKWAFADCHRLRRVSNMRGVIEIAAYGFFECRALNDLELGDKLEIIGHDAFGNNESLVSINMPSIKRVWGGAFARCYALSYAEFGEDLERFEMNAFLKCHVLRRLVIPLKENLIHIKAFDECENLSRVDVSIGGIHKTISSLHMDSWRDEIIDEINRINLALPELPVRKYNPDISNKTGAIEEWIRSVLQKIDRYKDEHCKLLKEAMVLLELALWKANLVENDGTAHEGVRVTRGQRKRARKESCITSGAGIIIKNVLPFLELE
jgi:hypothetical protein